MTLAERISAIHNMIYKINDNIPHYSKLVALGDRIMVETPDELAALALLTVGMNWNAALTFLETEWGLK